MPQTPKQLNCRLCGKAFDRNNNVQKYCSDDCRISYWSNDPESQARAKEYRSSPEAKARANARLRERYRTDAAYRERVRQQSKEQYAKRRLDPEFKAKQREYGRKYRERKKLERSQGTETMAATDSSDV